MSRPWPIHQETWDRCMELFPKWLEERGGIVVYENHVFDSSSFGDRSYMPARFIAEDNQMHDAPAEHRPNGGVPSMRQQKVDHIKLEEFDGDLDKALACFEKDER